MGHCSFFQLTVPLSALLLLLALARCAPQASSTTPGRDSHSKKLRRSQPLPNKNLPAVADKNISMLPSEAETLFSIMDAMSADRRWRNSYPNPCKPGSTWLGIECRPAADNHFHVSRLDFGTHPNPSCKPSAVFPYQIFLLPHLQSVFFFNCFTRAKTTLSFSPQRLSNSSIQQFSLRSNPALVGPIPPQISFLRSLRILTLSQNRLAGRIPVEIFGLESLLHLDLSYNMLSGAIPFQLGNLKKLLGLDLSYNSFTGNIPTTIGQLGMLQKLDFSSNTFAGRIPDSIEKLSVLTFLALSNNRLRGSLPSGFPKLHSLQYVIMDDNPMNAHLPAEFSKLVKLQELRLANSGYTGTIPPSFAQLTNLTTLSLQNNKLTGAIPVGFGGLSRLYHLNLSRNLLVGVVPFNATFLGRLGKNLDLSSNPSLCLRPSEAEYVRIGIGVAVCGTANHDSFIREKSQASPAASAAFFFLYYHALFACLLLAHGFRCDDDFLVKLFAFV